MKIKFECYFFLADQWDLRSSSVAVIGCPEQGESRLRDECFSFFDKSNRLMSKEMKNLVT
jgi:hypothetical protein